MTEPTSTTARRYGPENPSEAQKSLAKFIRDVKGFDITDAAVSASFTYHGEWQSSDERHAELQQVREQAKLDRANALEAGKEEREAKAKAKEAEREAKRAEREKAAEGKAEERKAKEAEREAKKAEREAENAKKQEEREAKAKEREAKRAEAETERAAKQEEREAKRAEKEAERAEKASSKQVDGDDTPVDAPAAGRGALSDAKKRIRRRGDDEAVAAGVSQASF